MTFFFHSYAYCCDIAHFFRTLLQVIPSSRSFFKEIADFANLVIVLNEMNLAVKLVW